MEGKNNMETFGTRLSNLRKQHDMTQNDLAEKLNISPQAVSKWENDLTDPDISTLIKISDIFDVSIDELLGKPSRQGLIVEQSDKKDLNKLLFKISIDSTSGDKIRINLPIAVIKTLIDVGGSDKVFNGNEALKNIDFKQLLALVEEGVIGEILSIQTCDGDKVHIIVE